MRPQISCCARSQLRGMATTAMARAAELPALHDQQRAREIALQREVLKSCCAQAAFDALADADFTRDALS